MWVVRFMHGTTEFILTRGEGQCADFNCLSIFKYCLKPCLSHEHASDRSDPRAVY